MPPKFEIYKDAAEKFRFRLRAGNGEIIATGEAYEQHAGVIKGVKSVQKNCNSEVEDLTIGVAGISNPKYQVTTDENGKYRFHLKASNGEIIAQSEGYESKDGCMKGIEAVKNSCDAEIVDQTTTKTSGEQIIPEQPTAEKPVTEVKVSLAVEAPEKTVFVGKKMPMDYVLAIITELSKSKGVTLKARGQAITTAVDSAEIARRRFLKDLKISKIAIGTEEMPPREGETKSRMVSTIEIVLTKG
jgi:DNA-binding protein Alba